MGKMKRKCNKTCCDYGKKIRKPIHVVGEIMPRGFTDEYFVETFKWLERKGYHYPQRNIEQYYQMFGRTPTLMDGIDYFSMAQDMIKHISSDE